MAGLTGIDTVVHCASAVSFDPPIDEAFATNVGGTANLYAALDAAGIEPHVVHVSTAYVGGAAKGLRLEGRLPHEADWRVEFDAALQARSGVEAESRTPTVLRELLSQARSSHGKQGPKQVAGTSEQLRRSWVDDRLREAGRLRAQSLGWTDIYTFTKAMAERVAEEEWADRGRRLSVVRPSIIESSANWPYPGWIDGYKVADPLIIAYGRGLLPAFPALPDTVLDVIPVDHVVNAITALVTADIDRTGDDAYYQIVSGAGNPLPFHRVIDTIRAHFIDHPMQNARGEDVRIPPWKYRDNDAVVRRFAGLHAAAHAASTVVSRLPATDRTRRMTGQLFKQRNNLQQLRKYMDLYQHYTCTEMIFDDTNTRALLAALPADMRDEAGFDVGTIDWTSYLRDQHLPAIVELAEEYSAAKGSRAVARAQAGVPGIVPGHKVLAVFDLDGTVLNSNIVKQYLAVRRSTLPWTAWPGELVSLLASTPQLLQAEHRDRAEFIRMFTRRYAGLRVDELREQLRGELGEAFRSSVMADAAARIEQHREAGHRTVLVTGVFDLLVEPIAHMFDEVVAGRMHVRDGVMTEYLATPPLVAEARANWLVKYARTGGYDLAGSHAYGDSHADASWIELVGHPHAVNPDLPLYSVAKHRTWTIENWS